METLIRRKVCNLDWSQTIEIQNEAIEFLSKVDEKYFSLIFDEKLKSTWENAVKVIKNIGFPKNKTLIHKLIWLLQDINWPGSLEAIQVLLSIDKQYIIPLLESAILTAYERGDTMWLGGLNMLIKKADYSDSDFKKDIVALLKYADF